MWAAESASSELHPIILSSDTAVSTEGYFVLSWDAPAEFSDLTLFQETGPNTTSNDIRAHNLPAAGAITLTGLVDGDYTYRLLANEQPVSNIVAISVQHHSLSRALGFFSLGLLLFSVLIGSIVVGNKQGYKQGYNKGNRQGNSQNPEQTRAG